MDGFSIKLPMKVDMPLTKKNIIILNFFKIWFKKSGMEKNIYDSCVVVLFVLHFY